MIPDVNVLVAAFRHGHARHDVAKRWLEDARTSCSTGKDSLALLAVVVTGFLRIVTSGRVFSTPDKMEDAVAFLDALIGTPGAEYQSEGAEWPMPREKLLTLRLRSELVTDTWIAAAVQAHAEHLVTFDRDFQRLLPSSDLTLLRLGANDVTR